jgi:predicted RNase H-like nuclease (RuvC/YqgF family)
MSDQAKGLFIMSISLSSFTSIMGLMMLFGKWALLRDVDKADQEVRRKSAMVDMGSIYKDEDGDDGDDDLPKSISYSGENPMHTSALALMEQQKGENASLKEELEAKDKEVEAMKAKFEEQRKEIEQLRFQQQPMENL